MPARRPKPPASLAEVVRAGDRRASLESLRDWLAQQLLTSERDQAALARQLTVVLRELDDLPVPAQESTVDDLASKRAARRAKTASL